MTARYCSGHDVNGNGRYRSDPCVYSDAAHNKDPRNAGTHDQRFLSIARVTFDYLLSDRRTYTGFQSGMERVPAAWEMTGSTIPDAQRAGRVPDIQTAN
ncbi:hypothetical protein PQR53_25530 [Paraburkholderia fungorum]|uniref:hypothetical protein n=1 Tax=Paraburkholderia fungorum TaxID=134537 RepID=UPI0038B7C7EF